MKITIENKKKNTELDPKMLTHRACLVRASDVTSIGAHTCITVVSFVEMLARLVFPTTVNAI